jgi:hypothetical protein
MRETDSSDAGIASSIVNTTSEGGGAFGLAILATIGTLLMCACAIALFLEDHAGQSAA